ncbi:MAG: DUF4258 domain-containing protein [Chloroflexota bacterium]|nr:DUF4258 domain-containing protein [Chloroflexota bacterium]
MTEEDSLAGSLLAEIQARIKVRRYRLTSHAEGEREADQITIAELEEALLSPLCEVIEDYAQVPRGRSCLVLGFTRVGEPIHVVSGLARGEELAFITVYRPDPGQWQDWRLRKTQ